MLSALPKWSVHTEPVVHRFLYHKLSLFADWPTPPLCHHSREALKLPSSLYGDIIMRKREINRALTACHSAARLVFYRTYKCAIRWRTQAISRCPQAGYQRAAAERGDTCGWCNISAVSLAPSLLPYHHRQPTTKISPLDITLYR